MTGLALVGSSGGAWRSLRGGPIDRLIRLDRSIDPRLEGGLLVNAEGALIGMAVPGPRRAALAIPAETIDRVTEQLLAHGGRIPRGYLGLGLRPARLDDGQPQTASRGLVIVSLDSKGPAKSAGMLVGDVLTAWNGEPLHSVRDVLDRLGPDALGRRINLSIIRAGQSTSSPGPVAVFGSKERRSDLVDCAPRQGVVLPSLPLFQADLRRIPQRPVDQVVSRWLGIHSIPQVHRHRCAFLQPPEAVPGAATDPQRPSR
jgi:hypothetical protein